MKTHENKFNSTKVTSLILVPLMIISSILSETVFDKIQIIVEILLLGTLSGFIYLNRIDREDFAVLVIYLITNIVSIYYLKSSAWMLNVKQFGLPIFTLIFFKKRVDNSIFLHIAFILCVLLLIIQKIIGYFPLPLSQYMVNLKDEMEGRPLGLFLNYHFSAFFISTYLLGYTYKKKLYLIDSLIVSLFGVFTSIFSYLGQKTYNFYFRNRKPLTLTKQYFYYFFALFSFLLVVRVILDSLEIPENAISGLVIFYQLTDIETYIRTLALFPNDIYEFYNQELYDYTGTKVEGYLASGNEISFIQILVEGGLILGITFLNFIIKNITFYRIFILLSLIHYSYLFSPLIIYTMCYFENKNKLSYE